MTLIKQMHAKNSIIPIVTLCIAVLLPLGSALGDQPTYAQIQPILTKYCAGCHNADETNGEFSLDSYDALFRGGEHGTALTPGTAASSRIIQYMRGTLLPSMPPEGEPQPSLAEIDLIAKWIDLGAPGPKGRNAPTTLSVPKISPRTHQRPITALSIFEDKLAIGRYGSIQIQTLNSKTHSQKIEGIAGKVTSLAFLKEGKFLIAGTGVTGLYGEAVLIDLTTLQISKRFRGHRDLVYSVAISGDETRLATSGYDRKSVLWNLDSTDPITHFIGHNDAVFQNTFDPSGKRLLTASGDATVKIWQTSNGVRLDTRNEPLKSQHTVVVSPDGESFFSAGEDNRIRKWKLESSAPDQINHLSVSRFAHESSIQSLQFSPSGSFLFSSAANGSIKIWNPQTLTEIYEFNDLPAQVQAFALTDEQIIIGTSQGQTQKINWSNRIEPAKVATSTPSKAVAQPSELFTKTKPLPDSTNEKEPNNTLAEANAMTAPFNAGGAISDSDNIDQDLFRFHANQGSRWIIEARATKGSQVDTHIAVLADDGKPVPRVVLRSVRDSYFTFRGKNSTQTSDFRIHNWEEMKLNELLYCNGEVVRLYHYPRGPDSGYNVFPNFGKRHAMFDTTPIAHALHEPCFTVEAHPPGSTFPEIGLPVFELNYENDDAAKQEIGTDSRLTFTAPHDGDYFVRVRDSRDFGGDKFGYSLSVRNELPDFKIRNVIGKNPKLAPGGYQRLEIEVDRIDNFAGAVQIEIKDLPPGIRSIGPVEIEPGGLKAWMTLHASLGAKLEKDTANAPILTATAVLHGKPILRESKIGAIELVPPLKLAVALQASTNAGSTPKPSKAPISTDVTPIPEIHIRPGETTTAEILITRAGHMGRVNFGSEDAALNLPFGVYVDNTGLNGVLIPPEQNSRKIFLTAERWVEPCSRLIFVRAGVAGNPCSNPIRLTVLPKISE
ncbi:hypothetical protein N9B46_00285 [Mariniblastus sp.]|nr:hypothetical protein [Mariniblastus sp.]